MKGTKDKLAMLLLNYIAKYLGDIHIMNIRYCTGWAQCSDNKKVYFVNCDNPLNIDAPFFNNKIAVTNTMEPVNSCKKFFHALKVFVNASNRILVLGVMSYSLIFSLLRDVGIKSRQLIIVSGDAYNVKTIVNFFFDFFNKQYYVSLNQKNSDIKDEIKSTADSPIIIDARGCDFGNYKPKANLECVKDMVAFDGYIEVSGIRIGIQAPVIMLSNELGYTLDSGLFFELEICSDDINTKTFGTLYNYKEQLGDLIIEFLKYMENIDIKSWLMNREDYEKGQLGIYSDTYDALSIGMSLFESFLSEKYDMDINSLLNIKYDWRKYMKAYFNKDIEDVKGVISLFQEKIYDTVNEERLIEKYDNRILDVDTMDKYIFILGDEVCIRHNAIMNIIIPDMNIGIKARHLLKYLDKANMLVMNRNSYECKRVMCYPDGNKRQESFVIIKRKYYKTDKTEETEINERKNRDKTEEQNYWDF
jgi:hypothetical protein